MNLREGLIWFDNSPRVGFADKVGEAAAAFERRYHRPANICYVNPQDLPAEAELAPAALAVEAERSVLRHHFFVGVRPGR